MRNKHGISIIVLVVVMVILMILTTAVFVTFKNNTISETIDELEFKSEIGHYNEEIKKNIMNEYNNNKDIFDQVIEDKYEIELYCKDIMKSNYIDYMFIKNGELYLKKNMLSEDERKWAKEAAINIE